MINKLKNTKKYLGYLETCDAKKVYQICDISFILNNKMGVIFEAIHLLEVKLQNLLANYEFLKEENKALLQNNSELHLLLEEKEQELANQKKEYDLLKVAKTIEGSKENSRNTKLKINTLIREIDKCIDQLNS